MNAPAPPKILVAVFNHLVCIKVNGKGDFISSVDLKKLVNELWSRGYSRFTFELCNCQTMDSTFLGVLSGIGLKFSGGKSTQPDSPVELLNPNPRISETLENLGVSGLFSIRTCAEPVTDKFEPLAQTQISQREITKNCLEAHEVLVAINPENAHKFHEVVRFLADDLKKLDTRNGNDKIP